MEKKDLKIIEGSKKDPVLPEIPEEERHKAQEEFFTKSIYDRFTDLEQREKNRKLIEEAMKKEIPLKRLKKEEIDPELAEWFHKQFGDVWEHELTGDVFLSAALEHLKGCKAGEVVAIKPHTAAEYYLFAEGRFMQEVQKAINLKQKAIELESRKAEKEARELIKEEKEKEKEKRLIKIFGEPEHLTEKRRARYDEINKEIDEKYEQKLKDKIASIREETNYKKEQIKAQIETLAHNLWEQELGLKNSKERLEVINSAIEALKEAA